MDHRVAFVIRCHLMTLEEVKAFPNLLKYIEDIESFVEFTHDDFVVFPCSSSVLTDFRLEWPVGHSLVRASTITRQFNQGSEV